MIEKLSFKDMLKALDHLPKTKKAAICIHDDLDVARTIAEDLFESCDHALIFKIRELLVEEKEFVKDDD